MGIPGAKACTDPIRVEINGLFAENRFAGAGKQFNLLGMKVCWRAEHNGVDIISSNDRIHIPDLRAVTVSDRKGGGLDRIGDHGKHGVFIAANSAGMNLADTAGSQNGETDGHWKPL